MFPDKGALSLVPPRKEIHAAFQLAKTAHIIRRRNPENGV